MKIKEIKIALFVLGLLLFALFPNIPKLEMVTEVFAVTGEDLLPSQDFERVVLHVDGMTCRKCVKPLKKALLRIPGVKIVDVSYSEGRAFLECEKGKVSDAQLVRAIEDQSTFFYTYKASVVERE